MLKTWRWLLLNECFVLSMHRKCILFHNLNNIFFVVLQDFTNTLAYDPWFMCVGRITFSYRELNMKVKKNFIYIRVFLGWISNTWKKLAHIGYIIIEGVYITLSYINIRFSVGIPQPLREYMNSEYTGLDN